MIDMAYKGKTIFNSRTKIGTKFLQTSKDTGGQLLEMETTYPARSPQGFSREFRLTKPKLWVQRLVFGVLSPFAWLAGYRSTYKKYLD
ncbi:MAG: hypothetical protein OHK0019_14590 [Saprospiraceae bacterium]